MHNVLHNKLIKLNQNDELPYLLLRVILWFCLLIIQITPIHISVNSVDIEMHNSESE